MTAADDGPVAVLDVHYHAAGARAACVVAPRWDSEKASEERVCALAEVAAYQPGEFYRRELPCLLAVLAQVAQALGVLVVDAYVDLDADKPGLGAHLHEALGGRIAVVGIAKTLYRGGRATPVLRGSSVRPLLVSARGMDLLAAAARVKSMHGPHRIPALVSRADHLARGLSHAVLASR
jgi:deoxyribonuclease V